MPSTKLSDVLLVSEIFRSLQGEGPFTGTPATFLRLAYCNLHCVWCDAWYTWDHSRVNLKEEAKRMSVASVKAQLGNDPLIVVTGGEPLLQQRALYHVLTPHVYTCTVQFETNGTLLPVEMRGLSATYVVSPKLENNGRDTYLRRMKYEPLKWFAGRGAYFKFVIREPQDVEAVANLVHGLGIGRENVYLMPEGRSVEELDGRALWVADVCKRHGWMYSDRLHIRLWGDKRGT